MKKCYTPKSTNCSASSAYQPFMFVCVCECVFVCVVHARSLLLLLHELEKLHMSFNRSCFSFFSPSFFLLSTCFTFTCALFLFSASLTVLLLFHFCWKTANSKRLKWFLLACSLALPLSAFLFIEPGSLSTIIASCCYCVRSSTTWPFFLLCHHSIDSSSSSSSGKKSSITRIQSALDLSERPIDSLDQSSSYKQPSNWPQSHLLELHMSLKRQYLLAASGCTTISSEAIAWIA